MSKEVRSRGACWTCRLRRKKCDENVPACSACSSQAIPCYGYDKPAWADDGSKQKAKALELRIIIRELASIRRKVKFANVKPAEDISVDVHVPDLKIRNAGGTLTTNCVSRTVFTDCMPEIRAITRISELSSLVLPDIIECDLQADLLIHYLDVVFPSQFPFYNPSEEEGGRAWLLWLILQTKPLYLITLSIAAYHQQVRCRESNTEEQLEYTVDLLQTHHSLAIKELRVYLEAFKQEERAQSLEGNIEVLACIVFLISLEVFNGESESWPIHLQAAKTLLPGLKKGCLKHPDPNEPLSPIHQKAHQFFIRVTSWYDMMSAATTGLSPWAPRFCFQDELGVINFETVLGCANGVVVAIMEIASLNAWKINPQNAGVADVDELGRQARPIERALEDVLEKYSEGYDGAGSSESKQSESLQLSGTLENTRLDNTTTRKTNASAITRVFASAALVYLNVVVFGPHPDNPKIKESVAWTISALDVLPDPKVLGVLAWPLCLAGCMASYERINFFRKLVPACEKASDVKSGNLRKCFLIMEECWRLRREGLVGLDWRQAMESLDMKILLM